MTAARGDRGAGARGGGRLRAGSAVSWPDRVPGGALGRFPAQVDGINNQSVIAIFERSGVTALLTGDAGAPTERDLLESGVSIGARLLKVGHHGSRTATTPEFLRAVGPRLALLSCGRGNRFGHPAAQTLDALREARVPVLRTDLLSDVRATLEPSRTLLRFQGLR